MAEFSGVVFSGKEDESSALSPSEFWFAEVSGCMLCGVSEVDLKELVVSELRAVSGSAGWLWVVLGFSVFMLSELLLQLVASRAVSASRQKARK